jgi:hypothetical protein
MKSTPEKVANININYSENLNWNVEIIEWYLNILLWNILINARKHWDATNIDIDITEEDWFLVIKIKDDWSWIDIEKIWWNIENIFRKWVTINKDKKNKDKWTWIWLADADKHMKTMWWEISVENLEIWTEFTIKIPLVDKK